MTFITNLSCIFRSSHRIASGLCLSIALLNAVGSSQAEGSVPAPAPTPTPAPAPSSQQGTWVFQDSDRDGYGNPDVELFEAEGAAVPNGYVINADDCNDSNRSINPSATELVGDHLDNNCDGVVR